MDCRVKPGNDVESGRQLSPSPLEGEGWGEGYPRASKQKSAILVLAARMRPKFAAGFPRKKCEGAWNAGAVNPAALCAVG